MENMDLNFQNKLIGIAEISKYYTTKGLDTPSDEIDVELVIKDGKHHLFVLHYPLEDKNTITMLLKNSGESFSQLVESTLQHFYALGQKTPLSEYPSPEEQNRWNEQRKAIIAERLESGDIKPVKLSGSVIIDENRDIIGDLL